MAKEIRKGIELDESVLRIDELRLDRECVNQPKFYFSAAKRAADSRARMEEAKSAMDLVRAEVDAKVRANPSDYDLEKVTEGGIAKAVEKDADFLESREEFNRSRYELDIYQAFVNALDHKKSMLGHLVSLHGQNYFSDVRSPSPAGRDAVDDQRDERVAQSAKRKLGERQAARR